jgi:hypothetical protein
VEVDRGGNLFEKGLEMKRVMAKVAIASVVSIGIVGCTDSTKKASVKQETKVSTPGGTTTTTTTTEKEVKKTGEHPPASTP